MSAILDQAAKSDPQRRADLARTDAEMTQRADALKVHTMLTKHAGFASVNGRPGIVYSPAAVLAALIELSSGLADYITAIGDCPEVDSSEHDKAVAVSRLLDAAINEVEGL
jgi:hypothetical protein